MSDDALTPLDAVAEVLEGAAALDAATRARMARMIRRVQADVRDTPRDEPCRCGHSWQGHWDDGDCTLCACEAYDGLGAAPTDTDPPTGNDPVRTPGRTDRVDDGRVEPSGEV